MTKQFRQEFYPKDRCMNCSTWQHPAYFGSWRKPDGIIHKRKKDGTWLTGKGCTICGRGSMQQTTRIDYYARQNYIQNDNTKPKNDYKYTKNKPLCKKSEEKLARILQIDAEEKDYPNRPGITWQQLLNKVKKKEARQ